MTIDLPTLLNVVAILSPIFASAGYVVYAYGKHHQGDQGENIRKLTKSIIELSTRISTLELERASQARQIDDLERYKLIASEEIAELRLELEDSYAEVISLKARVLELESENKRLLGVTPSVT